MGVFGVELEIQLKIQGYISVFNWTFLGFFENALPALCKASSVLNLLKANLI